MNFKGTFGCTPIARKPDILDRTDSIYAQSTVYLSGSKDSTKTVLKWIHPIAYCSQGMKSDFWILITDNLNYLLEVEYQQLLKRILQTLFNSPLPAFPTKRMNSKVKVKTHFQNSKKNPTDVIVTFIDR